MQMYGALRVLTARPTPQEEAAAPHALYGCLAAHDVSSVARWLEMVVPAIGAAWAEHRLPLLVGGTGMYLNALMQGISHVPPIPPEVRQRVRSLAKPELWPALHAVDAVIASRLKAGDTQRLLRALEVVEATGISLSVWQQQKTAPLPEAKFHPFKIIPERAALYAKINARFEAMMHEGALEEVKNLPPVTSHSPLYKAHGVPELLAHLRDEMALDVAIAKAQQNTRNYAKRQLTWARHQLPDAQPVDLMEQTLQGFIESSYICTTT